MSETPTALSLNSLLPLIDAIVTRLDPILFPEPSLIALRSLAAKLAPDSPLLFELRMGQEDPSLDLSLPLSEDFSFYESRWGNSSSWQKIIALRQATRSGGELADLIGEQVFWCEFDFDQMYNTIPIPGVFLDISPKIANSRNNSFLAQLICRAFGMLMSQQIPHSIQQRLETTLQTLPEDVCLTHFGAMLSRLGNGSNLPSSLRANFSGWQLANLPSWLETIGCQAVVAEVAKVTRDIPQLLSRIMVTLDIGESISPRVGIECHPKLTPGVSSKETIEVWLKEFLVWLKIKSIANSNKAEAIYNWNGYNELPIELPDFLSGYYACATDISHFKLVFDPINGLQAKAYLIANFIHQDDSEHNRAPSFL